MGGRKQKAGEKGPSAQYITRGRALKKLQVSLAAFRRLCILKNIFPRDPPAKQKKRTGGDKVYYHIKDVLALQHEPLLRVFRQLRATKKKINKALGRREKSKAKRLIRSKPRLELQRIVKERFPTLKDAVTDLDDALCTISIYAVLPVYGHRRVKTTQVLRAAQLLDEFLLLSAHQRALRHVFASIKGYYFRLQLLGQDVVFLLPHFFVQTIPETVDMKVLSTFFSLYSTTLRFVNFKFYLMAGLAYPPSTSVATSRGRDKKKRIRQRASSSLFDKDATSTRKEEEEVHAVKRCPTTTATAIKSRHATAAGGGENRRKRKEMWGEACWRFPLLRVCPIVEEEEKEERKKKGQSTSTERPTAITKEEEEEEEEEGNACAASIVGSGGEEQEVKTRKEEEEEEKEDEEESISLHASVCKKEEEKTLKLKKHQRDDIPSIAMSMVKQEETSSDVDTAAETAGEEEQQPQQQQQQQQQQKQQQQGHAESTLPLCESLLKKQNIFTSDKLNQEKEKGRKEVVIKKKQRNNTSFQWSHEISPCGVAPHPVQLLFDNLVFFLNREIPLLPFCFIIRSCGGTVGWQGSGSPFDACDHRITHHIVDRPLAYLDGFLPEEEIKGREIVQPQWILDSVNAAVLLPIHAYAPGKTLPPHLSPFLDDYEEGYVPEQRRILDNIIAEKRKMGVAVSAASANGREIAKEEDSDAEENFSKGEDSREAEKKFQQQLEEEAAGAISTTDERKPNEREEDSTSAEEKEEEQEQTSSSKKSKDAAAISQASSISLRQQQEITKRSRKRPLSENEDDDLLEAKKSLLSKKHRRLLERIQHRAKEKEKRRTHLQAKRQALDKTAST